MIQTTFFLKDFCRQRIGTIQGKVTGFVDVGSFFKMGNPTKVTDQHTIWLSAFDDFEKSCLTRLLSN